VVGVEIRYLIFVLSIAAILLWVKAARRFGSPLYGLPAILWLMNVVVFNAARLVYYSGIPISALNNWALGIQIHGILTLLGLGFLITRVKRWTP